jgi:acetyl-CoA C-acetyltransferase
MKPIWIISAKRTPKADFSAVSRNDRRSISRSRRERRRWRESIRRLIDSVIVGNVLGAGLGMNVARQTGIGAGLP